jgi:type I restriction enzyme M protein
LFYVFSKRRNNDTGEVPCFSCRDKTSLDIFWLKDDSLTDLDNLPDPDVLVEDIIENLESSLESLKELSNNLEKEE